VPETAANAIARGGVAHVFAYDNSGARLICFQGIANDKGVCRLFATTNEVANLERRDDALCPRQHGVSWLRRKFGATLTATSRENGATSTRAHTRAEAVRLCATAIVGLEGALGHGQTPSLHRKALGWRYPRQRLKLGEKAPLVKLACYPQIRLADIHRLDYRLVSVIHNVFGPFAATMSRRTSGQPTL
jgi:hypothetical protein